MPGRDSLVDQWFDRAESDLNAAERIIDLTALSAFHSQQAVEKAIKAILIHHRVDYAKSHDIRMLLESLEETSSKPPEDVSSDIETLTRFAAQTRYPPEEVSPAQAEEALELARKFMNWAARELG